MKLNRVIVQRTRFVIAAPRILHAAGFPFQVMTLAAILAGASLAQITAPRYQSPIAAPQPQPLSLPAPTAITSGASVIEYPIVRVNDQIIDSSDYQRAQEELMQDAQRDHLSPAEVEQRQKDLLRDMIDNQLLLSRGKELDVNADAEVVRQLDEIRKQNKFATMEDLEKAVRESGLSYEDFKSSIRNRIITQQVVRDEVSRHLTLSAKQEQAYYEAHKQEYAQPEQPEKVNLSEILIPLPENATDSQIAQVQAKADEVEAKLKAGAKFEDMVKLNADSPNPDRGGELGVFARGDGKLAKVLEDQVFPLKTGETTAPIRTRTGFIILKVTEHTPYTPAGIPPLSAIDVEIQNAIFEEQMKPALRTYLTGLREKAYIDIQPGFVDTGASPKESKPVFTASTLPPVKKKKVEKARLDQTHAAAGSTAAATAGAATKPVAGASVASTTPPAVSASSAKAVKVSANGKRKKIHREKIRYGQAPRNSLPASPEETVVTAGADQGAGATSNVVAGPGVAVASVEQPTTSSSEIDPLAPKTATGKTRYSDRAPIEAKQKAAAKVIKVQQKVAATPAPLTAEEKAALQTQDAPLGLAGDTAAKKKKKKVKGEPKERLQDQPPAPPAAKPEATPIPPKSVRDNGEPVVTPPPNPSTIPSSTAAPGAPVDTQPSSPANPIPAAQPPQ